MCFDLTDRLSFEYAEEHMREAARYTARAVKLLVGCKADLESDRVVFEQEIGDYCRRTGVMYWPCSAKSGYNVKELFDSVLYLVEEKARALAIALGDVEGRKRRKAASQRKSGREPVRALSTLEVMHERRMRTVMTLLLLHSRREGSVWVVMPREVVHLVIRMAYGNVHEGHHWHGVTLD